MVPIQTNLVSGTVWTQFAMQILTGVANPQFGGRGGRMGSELVPQSSPSMTSYRLPMLTIGPSLIVFAVLRMFQTDRHTESQAER